MELSQGVFTLDVDVEFFGEPRTWTLSAVETRNGVMLFDVGGLGDFEPVKNRLESEGFSLNDVSRIVITHHDVDHAGCIPEVLAKTDADVITHKAAAPYVRGQQPLLKRSSVTYEPAPVDIQLVGGEIFDTVADELRVLHTPGHAPGHLVFYLPESRVLLAADLFHGEDGLTGPSPDVTPDMDRAYASMQPLLSLDIETIVCFHGGVVEAGTDDIQRVIDDYHEST